MLYAILAFHDETEVKSMTEAEDNALMDRLMGVHARHEGRLGPAARLGATELAAVVRGKGLVTDGPFAETKDLIAGWMVIDVDSYERAVELAGELSAAPGAGGEPIHEWLELRPFLAAPSNFCH